MIYQLNNYYNIDCMQAMKDMPDNFFDLAIVDPPYGIGVNKMTLGNGKCRINRGQDDWDIAAPPLEYFTELKRVSKNQIIWGANHFMDKQLPNSRGWIFWDKGTGKNDYSDGELAWTSFDRPLKKYLKSWVGANAKERNETDRIHPTQKPICLYSWILQNYAKKGDKILDTHCGSAGSLIACHRLGFDYMGFEIDESYYKTSLARLEAVKRQITIFDLMLGGG